MQILSKFCHNKHLTR